MSDAYDFTHSRPCNEPINEHLIGSDELSTVLETRFSFVSIFSVPALKCIRAIDIPPSVRVGVGVNMQNVSANVSLGILVFL